MAAFRTMDSDFSHMRSSLVEADAAKETNIAAWTQTLHTAVEEINAEVVLLRTESQAELFLDKATKARARSPSTCAQSPALLSPSLSPSYSRASRDLPVRAAGVIGLHAEPEPPGWAAQVDVAIARADELAAKVAGQKAEARRVIGFMKLFKVEEARSPLAHSRLLASDSTISCVACW